MDRTLNQDTYERLKQDIMKYVLKPGEQVSAAKLAERYEVSRTPVREALVKLQTEGLVDIFPQSKSVISRISLSRARQEWFIRSTLEFGMVDAFFDRVTEEDIAFMEQYNQEMKEMLSRPLTHELNYHYLCSDNAFHAVTYRVAGENLAAEVISNTMAHYNRVRLLVDMEHVFKNRTLQAHDLLMDYVRMRDRESYRRLIQQHLSHIVNDMDQVRRLFPDYFEL